MSGKEAILSCNPGVVLIPPVGWHMKVIHKDQEHLVSLSSDEVALLMDLCFAGACSDLLPSTNSAKTRLRGFIGQVQESLLDTAQQEWLAKRGIGHQGT